MTMQPIVFKVALFEADDDQARSQYSLLWMMEALVRIDQSHLRQMRHLYQDGKVNSPYPPLYRAGVHYERERGTEEWLDIPHVLEAASGKPAYPPGAWGDCEDLAAWRTAELRELPWHLEGMGLDGEPMVADPRFMAFYRKYGGRFRRIPGGIKAKPFAKWRRRPDGSYAYHALTLLPDGRLEDPSLVLGMTWEKEFQELKLAEKYRAKVLPVMIRYTDTPDVVVVDTEKPSGYGGQSDNNIAYARQAVGLESEMAGFRSGRLWRLGRASYADANWANRFRHISSNISYPSF